MTQWARRRVRAGCRGRRDSIATVSSADPLPRQAEARRRIVAAEVGSACLEGVEPDANIVALAEAFAAGQLSETDFDAAVEEHQQAVAAESRRRLSIAGRE